MLRVPEDCPGIIDVRKGGIRNNEELVPDTRGCLPVAPVGWGIMPTMSMRFGLRVEDEKLLMNL